MAKKQKSSSDEQRNHSQESEYPSSDDQFVQQPSQSPNLFSQSDSVSESDSSTTPPPSTIPFRFTIQSIPLKRPANDNDSKRLKKKKGTYESEEDSKKAVVDSRKLFQRLWSEEDEIAILKGMVEFTSKTGKDPYIYAYTFSDFLMKSLHVECINQLKEKIRRLKKKFENNAHRGKNGEDPNFSKSFDRETFQLSKKIWGNAGFGGAEKLVKGKSDRKVVKSPEKELARSTDVAVSKPKPELKLESRSVYLNKDVKMDVDDVTESSSFLMEVVRANNGVLGSLTEEVVKRGMELIGASMRSELHNEWMEYKDAEFELKVMHAELLANHSRLILEACKSSNH